MSTYGRSPKGRQSEKLKNSEIKDWLILRAIPGISDNLYKRLIERFSSPEKVLGAKEDDLAKVPEIRRDVVRAIVRGREGINISEELERIKRYKIDIITLNDESYSENLKEIYDPPPLLYVKGKIKKEDKNAIAIVGSRRATTYGKLTAQKLSAQLAAQGITIVSGMARGIDSEAHKAALAVGGRTIAVLGCGIDVVYPPENRALEEKIASSGAVITEFPFGTRPFAGNFPKRNRIISGLSLGVVIVEAAEKSGALITARFALEQGREVFAVPGSTVSPYSRGTHNLIKEGAKLVEDIDDILEELESLIQVRKGKGEEAKGFPKPPLSKEEEIIYNLITQEPKHIDILIQESKLPAQGAMVVLTNLQIKSLIKELSGKNFVRKR
ncbi:DNA-processing protein DprA [bacterium]|nr:DNA-processing protein DprA [bacterium]